MKFRIVIVALWIFALLIAGQLFMTVLFTISPSTADALAQTLGQNQLSQLVQIFY